MKFNELIYKTEVKDGEVQIPLTFIDKAREQGKGIEVITPEGHTYITPFDYPQEDSDDVPYQIIKYKFEPVATKLTTWEQGMLTRFHPNWFNLLRDLLQEENFKPLLQKVATDRTTLKVYPSKDDMLKPFAIDPDGIRVVFVGQTPRESELGLWDLSYQAELMKKGFWWINTNVTQLEELPFSHADWEPFVRQAVKRINRPIVVTKKDLLPLEGATIQVDLTIDRLEKLYELF